MRKYVCVLATNNYLDGCLLLNENLKHINSQYELLCLINEEIDQKTRNTLDYFNIEYKEIKKINYDVDFEDYVQPYFKNTFDKLSVFNLTEYEKVVCLDLDLLILENIDELFTYNGLAMAYDYPFSNLHNSGVMVIKPNKVDYENLIKIMIEKMNKQEQLGDQDIINEYFTTINTLPQGYNLMRRINSEIRVEYSDIWDEEREIFPVRQFDEKYLDKKILHYIVTPKPFQINHAFDEIYSHLYEYYLCIIREKKMKMKKETEIL